jgi:hypothetical protein
VGVVSPDAELSVDPGVIVNTHVPAGAMFPQLPGDMVVPVGRLGDGEYVTDFAVFAPVLVMVIKRGVPVSWALRPTSFTESARFATLELRYR